MKKLFPIFLALLLLVGCGKKEPEETIKCTVSPTETTIQTEPPATEDTGPEGVLDEKDTQTVYLLKQAVRTADDSSLLWCWEYEYDAQGNLVEERLYNEDNQLFGRLAYSAYENGYPLTIDDYFYDYDQAERLAYSRHFSYDENGNILTIQWIQNGTVSETNTFTYDDHGNVLSQRNTFGEEELTYAYEYTYDDKGNVLTCREFQNNEPTGTTEQIFDASGTLVSVSYFDYSGYLVSREEITWEGTTKTKITYDMDGNVTMTDVTTYDENGNITFQENQYPDGTVTMTEYFYEPFEITK